ncbi:hypothetical protein BKA65DRAFT_556300 [Rhexocercosporidium sp. MPI-PUGE-AT-0058]|nr:hypothetical protein BKA65DRAFT_556300 [Rhexocercosporidium sp. MPI-PUGE-AT-0058]
MESPRKLRPGPVVEELTRWEEFKVQLTDTFEEGIRLSRVPFSIAVSTFAVCWLLSTIVTLAGPAICDFPGTASLDICKLNTTYLATHNIYTGHNTNGFSSAHKQAELRASENHDSDNYNGFEGFTPKYAEIQIMTAKSYATDEHEIRKLHQQFIRFMINLTLDVDMWYFTMVDVRGESTLAAHGASYSLENLKREVERSLSFIVKHYQNARDDILSLKKLRAQSTTLFDRTLLRPGIKSTSTIYNERLSKFHTGLSSLLDACFEKAVLALQQLSRVEDSIEKTLQDKFYVEGQDFNLDANMESCAEYSRSVKEARKLVGSIYLLLLDMKKMLDGLGEDLASDIDIWAIDKETQESRVDYYSRILTKGIEILIEVGEEAKELKENKLTKRLQIDAKKL